MPGPGLKLAATEARLRGHQCRRNVWPLGGGAAGQFAVAAADQLAISAGARPYYIDT